MTDSAGSAGALTHYRRLSWRHKILEHKSLYVFFISAMFVGLLGGLIAPFVYKFVAVALYIPVCVLLLLGIGSAAVFGARLIDRKIFGAMKAGVVAVEDRIISGDTKTQMDDFEKLVAGYLKLRRMEAADYYSKKLLELSKSGGQQVMKLTDWLVTTECWVSSEQYQKSWNYKMIWLFETRGVLTLSPTKLDFQSKKLSFTCSPANIVSMEIKRHPLWMKPIPFRFISMTIDEMGVRHTFNLTPSYAQTDTLWDCNRLVDLWYQRIQRVRQGSTHTASDFPDWMKNPA